MRIRSFCFLGLAVLLASCTSVAPVKVAAGDQCYRCRRTISDEKMAGEMIQGSFVSKFKAPGCMAKYLVDHPNEHGTVFVTDYTTGKMFAPDNAYFVPLTVNIATGERDYHAFRDRNAADLAAADLKTTAVDWKTVLDRARS